MEPNVTESPPPLYTNPDIAQYLSAGTLHKFDVLQNYVYMHGNYLLTEPKFQLFDITYGNSKAIETTIQDLSFLNHHRH